jgi:hypothetical protein
MTSWVEKGMSFVGTIHFEEMKFIPLNENDVELYNVRVRDSSEKPTDQWSANGIG